MTDLFDALLKIEQQTQNVLLKFKGGEQALSQEAPAAIAPLESSPISNKRKEVQEPQDQLAEARRLQVPLNDRARILFEDL